MSEQSSSQALPDWYRWTGSNLTLQLQVQPRSSKNGFGEIHNGRLKVHLTSPPVDGRANLDLISFLAKQFGIPKACVQIRTGAASRLKTVVLAQPVKLPPGLGIQPADWK